MRSSEGELGGAILLSILTKISNGLLPPDLQADLQGNNHLFVISMYEPTQQIFTVCYCKRYHDGISKLRTTLVLNSSGE